jgi:hypothetical protein
MPGERTNFRSPALAIRAGIAAPIACHALRPLLPASRPCRAQIRD